MNPTINPNAPHSLPSFIVAPGQTDTLMIIVAIILIVAVLALGNLFLYLHSLPERMAHKSQKLQFELVAVLCLIALFTHINLFWVAGLVLAMIDLPDLASPLRRIARSSEKLAGIQAEDLQDEPVVEAAPPVAPPSAALPAEAPPVVLEKPAGAPEARTGGRKDA